jgi:nucleoside-diphosphate-sugar epimerase
MIGNTKTIAFFGASTGVGLSALKHTLTAGHQCIALCRTPSKLTTIFPTDTAPNLKIVQGDAHDITSVSQCLRAEDGKLVDIVVSTIGSRLVNMSIEDPEVCGKGAATLLEALAKLRLSGVTGSPHIVVCSTTGISRFGRDLPLAMIPLYRVLIKVPHKDKVVMEDRLMGSQEAYTIVRASLFTGGESTREIRLGIEDPKTGPDSKAIGYTISREDTGKWIAENLILKRDAKYYNKIATITY